jgi:medium-chain acyl-[acyl-carrier-protein] hydrolase
MERQTPSRWLFGKAPDPQARFRLFCVPYAGSGASVFRNWSRALPANVEVCPVELPGRGTRRTEPPFTQLGPLVEAASGALAEYFDRPFAFFGHSMGALISYELARHLGRSQGPQPVHLFVSGCPAPELADFEVTYHLPEPEFLEELRRLDGTPKDIFEHPELLELLLPLLRADFEAFQTYVFVPSGPPLDCGITAFGGSHDHMVNSVQLAGWRNHTTSSFSAKIFEGDHFFLHKTPTLVLEALSEELRRLITLLN